ncbi:MAG: phage holin family protein [Emticicia sp.]|nr:phage holin family protein [Emticicia sp.]
MSDFLKIGELKENLVKLIEAKFELTKLSVQDKIEGIAVKAAYALITFILSIIVVIFLSILIAIGLNNLIGSSWLGFLIMFSVYAIILAIFIIAKASVLSTIKKRVEEIVDENL